MDARYQGSIELKCELLKKSLQMNEQKEKIRELEQKKANLEKSFNDELQELKKLRELVLKLSELRRNYEIEKEIETIANNCFPVDGAESDLQNMIESIQYERNKIELQTIKLESNVPINEIFNETKPHLETFRGNEEKSLNRIVRLNNFSSLDTPFNKNLDVLKECGETLEEIQRLTLHAETLEEILKQET